jgi:hypothetical protein
MVAEARPATQLCVKHAKQRSTDLRNTNPILDGVRHCERHPSQEAPFNSKAEPAMHAGIMSDTLHLLARRH